MIFVAMMLVALVGLGTQIEVEAAATEAQLRSGDFVNIEELVKTMREKLGIAGIESKVAKSAAGISSIESKVAKNAAGISSIASKVAKNAAGISSNDKKINKNTKEISSVRGSMISCVTGSGTLWAIKDGYKNWHPTTVNFGRKFAGKPQFMVAASAAGKRDYVIYCPGLTAVEFEIGHSLKVTASSATFKGRTITNNKCSGINNGDRSYINFQWIACGRQ